jgi:two-component system, chemotaxis family, protein-glutamate methylesterase/glutaminase
VTTETAPRVGVLIVDDSAVARRLLTLVLADHPNFRVVGLATNGRTALERIRTLRPDAVILDVEMPVLDGIGTLAALRAEHPDLPVIMFSAVTERGAAVTLEALSLGATDYVTKPAGSTGHEQAVRDVREQLIPKILAAVQHRRRLAGHPVRLRPRGGTTSRPPGPVDVVAIGGSAGGPNALQALLAQLPGGFPLPVLVVQHMPAVFTRQLAERLAGVCPLPIGEAVGDEPLVPGHVWIAPGGRHLAVRSERVGGVRVVVHDGPAENSCRPAVDVLFRSLAETYGSRVLAVVLTGMGKDGLEGARRVRRQGGWVLAQDEASAVVWSMPGGVVRAGLADGVLPPAELGKEIVRCSAVGRRRSEVASTGDA